MGAKGGGPLRVVPFSLSDSLLAGGRLRRAPRALLRHPAVGRSRIETKRGGAFSAADDFGLERRAEALSGGLPMRL